MATKVIETKQVKVQASPIFTKGLTCLKIYSAICEVTEYTTELKSQYSKVAYSKKSIGNIYIVVDDNGNTRRFGNEYFRQVS